MRFTTQSMLEITDILTKLIQNNPAKTVIESEVINPDIKTSAYAGEVISLQDSVYIYRGYKDWIDLIL